MNNLRRLVFSSCSICKSIKPFNRFFRLKLAECSGIHYRSVSLPTIRTTQPRHRLFNVKHTVRYSNDGLPPIKLPKPDITFPKGLLENSTKHAALCCSVEPSAEKKLELKEISEQSTIKTENKLTDKKIEPQESKASLSDTTKQTEYKLSVKSSPEQKISQHSDSEELFAQPLKQSASLKPISKDKLEPKEKGEAKIKAEPKQSFKEDIEQPAKKSEYYYTVESSPEIESEIDDIPRGILGQPTYHTHPHLIKPGELTCGITQLEYKDRRASFMERLSTEYGYSQHNHIVIIPGSPKQYMSDNIPYNFRQDSDLYYLTGCLEPSAFLVMFKHARCVEFASILFCHEKDYQTELWEGPMTGCSDAVKLFGVDEALPIESFNAFMRRSAFSFRPFVLWFDEGSCTDYDLGNAVKSALEEDRPFAVADPKRALHHLRLVKSPAEIDLIRDACNIGSRALNMAMFNTKPGLSESMVTAVLDFTARRGGADSLAFPPVVAGGPRATVIHYSANNQMLKDGEMLLVDAGAQRWLYNSDISRTWPVSGKFTDSQKTLYEIVLSTQKRLLEILDDQRPTLDQLFVTMCRLQGKYLKEAGIIPKSCEGSDLIGRAHRFCPHHVSHYLGLDIHDTGHIRRNIPLQNNMIITVEPGLYINPEDKTVPPEFRGIGIRIEDDVLITDSGAEILTDSCMKEVSDIEGLVGKSPDV